LPSNAERVWLYGHLQPSGAGRLASSLIAAIAHSTGEVRSVVVPRVTAGTLNDVLGFNVHPSATVHTDESPSYNEVGRSFERHQRVNHRSGEYVREGVSSNVPEGHFSQLKRSIDGTHHHVTVKHLDRDVAEYDFRYSTRKISDDRQRDRAAAELRATRGRLVSSELVVSVVDSAVADLAAIGFVYEEGDSQWRQSHGNVGEQNPKVLNYWRIVRIQRCVVQATQHLV
jgi:transposase-like protein